MAGRAATKAEVLAFVDAGPRPSLQAGWVHAVYDAAVGDTIQYVNEVGGNIVGFGILAEFSEADASPAGWWLAYAWNDPMGPVAWDMAEAGIADLAAEGHTFVRGACLGPALCGGRCTPYVGSQVRDNLPYPPGTAGYFEMPGEWRLLSEGSHKAGEAFYTVNTLDTHWKP